MKIEITKEVFNSIVEDEQNCFYANEYSELAEKTYFDAKGMQIMTIRNFISNTIQYYLTDINA